MQKITFFICLGTSFFATAQNLRFDFVVGMGKMNIERPYGPSSQASTSLGTVGEKEKISFIVFNEEAAATNLRFGVNANYKFLDLFSGKVSLSANLEGGFSKGGGTEYRPPAKFATHSFYLNIQPQITIFKYFNLSGGVLYDRFIGVDVSRSLIKSKQDLWAYTLNPSVSYKRFHIGAKFFSYQTPVKHVFRLDDNFIKIFGEEAKAVNWRFSNFFYVGYTFAVCGKKEKKEKIVEVSK